LLYYLGKRRARCSWTRGYSCRSAEAEKLKGGLSLDTRDGLRAGGDSGAIIDPGSPEKSLLIMALRYNDDGLKMPMYELVGNHDAPHGTRQRAEK